MYNLISENMKNIFDTMQQAPQAFAIVKGGNSCPNIEGRVLFYQTRQGVIVVADVTGLPSPRGRCENPIFAFHIHEGKSCTGNTDDPFANALMHFDPNQCLHPNHAGDLPPLFGNNGTAFSIFLTNRFSVNDIIGRTIIIHDKPDDFTTQPSGNSGSKIACGVINGLK